MKKLVQMLMLSLTLLLPTCHKTSTAPQEPTQAPEPVEAAPLGELTAASLKVLFIGNSLTYYNAQPFLFWRLAVEANKKVYVEQATIPAAQLSDHLNREFTKKKIRGQKWDIVILQEAVFDIALPESASFMAATIQALQEQILANNNQTRIIYCLPYATRDGMTWRGTYYTYTTAQTMLSDGSRAIAQKLDLMVAPVGWAWYETIKQRPALDLFDADKSHPSLLGSYLGACVYFVTIFQESVENNVYIVQLNLDTARLLQTVASKTVLDRPDYWNVKPIVIPNF